MFLPAKGRFLALVWLILIIAGTGLYALGLYFPSVSLAGRWVAGLHSLRTTLPQTLALSYSRFVRPFSSGVQKERFGVSPWQQPRQQGRGTESRSVPPRSKTPEQGR